MTYHNSRPIFLIPPKIKPNVTISTNIKDLSFFENFFLNVAFGRKNSFYIPTFKRDVTLAGDFDNKNYFEIKPAHTPFGFFKQTLSFYNFDEASVIEIIDIKKKDETELLITKETFNETLTPKTFLSELLLVRLNSDTLKITKKNAFGYNVALDFKEVIN